MEDEFNQQIIEAMRRRILEEINQGGGGSRDYEKIVNNIYGAGGGQQAPSGIQDRISPEDYDYNVDINRRDVFDEEGDKIGWNKNVRRYAEKKKLAQGNLE